MAELSEAHSHLPQMWQLYRSFSVPDVSSKEDITTTKLCCTHSCTGLQLTCNSSDYRIDSNSQSQLEKQCFLDDNTEKFDVLEPVSIEVNRFSAQTEAGPIHEASVTAVQQQNASITTELGNQMAYLRSKFPTHRRCHCRACCSCSPVDRLRGMCPGVEQSSVMPSCWRSASIDSGLQRFNQSDFPCHAQQLCRKSDVAANSVQLDCQETFQLIPSAVATSITVFPLNSVATCSSLAAMSDAYQSSAEDDNDDHDVFLPKPSSFIKSNVSALEFRQKFEVIILLLKFIS
jgi:hypothetical protein